MGSSVFDQVIRNFELMVRVNLDMLEMLKEHGNSTEDEEDELDLMGMAMGGQDPQEEEEEEEVEEIEDEEEAMDIMEGMIDGEEVEDCFKEEEGEEEDDEEEEPVMEEEELEEEEEEEKQEVNEPEVEKLPQQGKCKPKKINLIRKGARSKPCQLWTQFPRSHCITRQQLWLWAKQWRRAGEASSLRVLWTLFHQQSGMGAARPPTRHVSNSLFPLRPIFVSFSTNCLVEHVLHVHFLWSSPSL